MRERPKLGKNRETERQRNRERKTKTQKNRKLEKKSSNNNLIFSLVHAITILSDIIIIKINYFDL
jgi:hypothetical protein